MKPGAVRKKEPVKTILFNLCGHGHFDMQAYMDYQAGWLRDTEYNAQEVELALAGLPIIEIIPLKNYPLLQRLVNLYKSGVVGLQIETRLPEGTPSKPKL